MTPPMAIRSHVVIETYTVSGSKARSRGLLGSSSEYASFALVAFLDVAT